MYNVYSNSFASFCVKAKNKLITITYVIMTHYTNFLDDDFSALDRLTVSVSDPSQTSRPTHVQSTPQLPVDQELEYVKSAPVHWLYSARDDHWWHFDRESNEDLENAHLMALQTVKVTKHGITVDLQSMTQNSGRSVLRTTSLKDIKLRGIAGKKYQRDLMIPVVSKVTASDHQDKDDPSVPVHQTPDHHNGGDTPQTISYV
jgi:hypothetical protein